ncbi:DDE superfamily endonuclease [Phytophthora infestans]|uniref:DDE superfamily endonuclease n=1 Tax=Phytophthora infestans TaxID=4787 RepID=A0A8S9UGG4_PHYIN|nr:DDE superfamily endonuclease [Phytophthora infestans]
MEPTEPGGTPMDVDDGFLSVQHAAVNARAAQYAIHDRHGFAGGEDVEMGVPGDGSAGEADGDVDDDVIVSIFLLFITLGATFGTLDWRSLRAPPSERIAVRSDFYAKLKEQRSPSAYRKTLRCMPASFDALCSFLEPLYYRNFNYHLSQTRIIVERVFGKLKARFKVLHGVTDRRKHETNARMICSAAVLHNILIDIGDKQFKGVRDIEARKQAKNDSRQVMTAYNQNWDRTQGEVDLAIRKRNMYADRFYERDNEHK